MIAQDRKKPNLKTPSLGLARVVHRRLGKENPLQRMLGVVPGVIQGTAGTQGTLGQILVARVVMVHPMVPLLPAVHDWAIRLIALSAKPWRSPKAP